MDAGSLLVVLAEALVDHHRQLLGVLAAGDRIILPTYNFEDERALVVAFEGVLEGAHFVEDAAEGPDVAFVVVGLLLTELRRQVVRRPHHRMRKVRSLVQHLSHPQVSNLYLVIFGEEHVDGFDVSVEDLVGVEVLQAEAHL